MHDLRGGSLTIKSETWQSLSNGHRAPLLKSDATSRAQSEERSCPFAPVSCG